MNWLARLRQINAVVSALMLALFLIHAVGNAFLIMGVGMPTAKALAHVVVTLAVVHGVIGVVLTVQTVRTELQSGAVYLLRNTRFWTVRASGLAIAVFIVLHMAAFLQTGGGPYRVREFGTFELVTNICLVLSLALHVFANLRPLAISLGIGASRARAFDLGLVMALLLLLMGVAFVVYYLRWSVV